MALPQKTAAQIITAFELQVDDLTELSSAEELQILNRIYQRICAMMPWEFLKDFDSGSTSSDATSTYIDIPNDFAYFVENYQPTQTFEQVYSNASPKVVYVGTDYEPWQIVNWSDRRRYRNQSGICYYDRPNSKIRFTATPNSSTYEFDYVKTPDDLTTSDTPLLPGQFHDMLSYAMAVEQDIVDKSEKARSYAAENNAKFQEDLRQMRYWNAQQNLM